MKVPLSFELIHVQIESARIQKGFISTHQTKLKER